MSGTEDYYRQRAPEYDRVYEKPERQGDLRAIRAWLPHLFHGRRVLEVAAGTGYWTDGLADCAATVVATDVNAATLEQARARRSWPESVSFVTVDAFALGEVEGDFDAAFVGFFWSHVRRDDLDRFLNGIWDRLGPHAVVVFLDNRYVEGSNHPISRTDDEGNTYQRRRLDDGSEWEVLKNFPSDDELRLALEPHARTITLSEWRYYWGAVCVNTDLL
jgi:SAM-dependent methyltransferase